MSASPPRVVITGPPAAGKTTVRRVVARWLDGRGRTVPEVAVDDVLRRLYPRRTPSQDYRYDQDGAIILDRPGEQIPPAVHEAIAVCRRAAPGWVLELASNECAHLLESGRDLLAGALVLELSAPVEVRSRRNRSRGETLIPDDRLRTYPDRLPAHVTRSFEQAGAEVAGIDAHPPLETVIAAVLETLSTRVGVGLAILAALAPAAAAGM